MAELSNMPLLDENKNTSTLNNHIPGSDDGLLSSTNNGLKKTTSENAYQSPTAVKGNFSEINSNVNVLSPKNLNILSPELVGGGGSFLKSEVANGSLLDKTGNSFNTANESLLEETNNSFKSLSGSFLEISKSPNCSVKNLLDETLTKVESPLLYPNASLEREDFSNTGNSLNESNRCVSTNEASHDDSLIRSLNTLSLTDSPMGNNPSSDESKTGGLVKSSLKISPAANSSFANQASSSGGKPNTPGRNHLDTSSAIESPSTIQTSFNGEKPVTPNKTLLNTSNAESSTFNASNSEGQLKSSIESITDISAVEPPVIQISPAEVTSDSPAKKEPDTSAVEMAPVDQISVTEDKLNSSIKSMLDTSSTVEVPSVNQTAIVKDKLDSSVKSILNTSNVEVASVNQTSITEDKLNSSVKSVLNTSTVEVASVNQTSITEDKLNSSVKSMLNTSAVEVASVNQTSITEDKLNSSVKSMLNTSTVEVASVNEASISEDKLNSSVKSMLNSTSTIDQIPVDQTSFTEERLNSSVKSVSDSLTVEVAPVDQTSFTEVKADSSLKSPLNTSTVSSTMSMISVEITTPKNENSKSFDNDAISSAELPPAVQTSFTEAKADTSVASLQDKSTRSPLPDSYTNVCLPEKKDVSLDKQSPYTTNSASFTIESALSDSSLSNKVVENTEEINNSVLGHQSSLSINSGVSSHPPVSQTTPKGIGKKLDSSRLINFSMIQDECMDEKSLLKGHSIVLNSANTPDQIKTDSQHVSHSSIESTEMSASDIPETFDGGLHDIPGDKITVTGEDPFGMQKSDPFDLITEKPKPSDDFVFKVPENPVSVENEEFTDAVQFFKDPSSFQFLENIKTSQSDPEVPRSSLYIKFDPLHSIFPSQKNADGNDVLQALKNEANIDPNKHLNVSARESLGNILISFDSPRFDCRDVPTPVKMAPVKVYTEEELQQQLKVSELTNQEMLLKKQREMEEELMRKERELVATADEKDTRIEKLENLLKAQSKILQEFVSISVSLKEQNKDVVKKMEAFEEENTKLKGDVKTLADDLQSVETTFADFHKRYEQCKGMLKTYKENEELLRTKLKDQEQAYQDLQNSTQEASAKTNSEIASVKKTSEGQIAVLRAQLKKAELKISSLESDINKIKIENSQLGGLCDDLMEKVGKS